MLIGTNCLHLHIVSYFDFDLYRAIVISYIVVFFWLLNKSRLFWVFPQRNKFDTIHPNTSTIRQNFRLFLTTG